MIEIPYWLKTKTVKLGFSVEVRRPGFRGRGLRYRIVDKQGHDKTGWINLAQAHAWTDAALDRKETA